MMDFALLTLAAAFQAVKASHSPDDLERLRHICTLMTLLTSMSATVEAWKEEAVNSCNKGTPHEDSPKKRRRSQSPDGPEKKKKKKKKRFHAEATVAEMLKSVATPQGEKIRSSRTSDAPDKGTSSSTSDALVKGVSSVKGKSVGKKTVENVDRAKSKTILGEPVKKKSSRTKKPGTVEALAPSQITIHKQVEVKTKHPSSSKPSTSTPVQWSDGEARQDPWEILDGALLRAVDVLESRTDVTGQR